ncbi:hypothetical protein N7603_04950 [Acholeplasma vituli]|uniref:HNH endonuclease n=1 Tax=Paracholeplasma vituli TaxID=69473 RepID=A0ABT2PVL6_9MOLU|nr:hypothetical protein [Paracholeplasma vituli]MCU0104999.1 hypothetical protein [Paracholeplasma vituli]
MMATRDEAMSLWNERYGDRTEVPDFAGYLMRKGAYNDRNSQYGWNIHHKQPLTKGGQDDKLNIELTSIYVNDTIANKTSYVIDDVIYETKRIKKPEYGIYRKDNGERVDYEY